MKKKLFSHYFLVVSISLVLISCGGLQYSQTSDMANDQISAEMKTLIDKATESYSLHSAEVDTLKAHIDRIVQIESGRKQNQATTEMWKVVQTDKQSLYGFFDLWKQQDKLSPAFITEIKNKMSATLTLIDTWEQSKKNGPLFNK